MLHDLRRQGDNILPVVPHIDNPHLFTLDDARQELIPCNRNMRRHIHLLELGRQRADNRGRRELVAGVVLHNDPRANAAQNMTVLGEWHINQYHITTHIRFHSYPFFLAAFASVSIAQD